MTQRVTPYFQTHFFYVPGSIYCVLGGGGGVYGGHESLHDSKALVDDGGQRCEAVCRAGRIRHNVDALVVSVVVDTHDKHRGVILGGCGDEHLLCATCQVGLGLLPVNKNPGALANIVRSGGSPGNVGGILLAGPVDRTAIDHELACKGNVEEEGGKEEGLDSRKKMRGSHTGDVGGGGSKENHTPDTAEKSRADE
jgi:hypothetical protein